MSKPNRYRNPSPPRTSGPVPVEEVELHGQRKWPDGTNSVRLTPAGPPPTEVTLHPQGRLSESVVARRRTLLEALATLAADPNLTAEGLFQFVRTRRYDLDDPQTWTPLGELLVGRPALACDRTFHFLFAVIGWRLAAHWLGSAAVHLRAAAAVWLVENGLTLWDTLDDPAKKRVAELLHEKLRLAEAEQRGHRDVLTALESFGRSSRQLP